LGEKLGEGNFGAVYKGVWMGTTPVALKKIAGKENVVEDFEKEAKILQ
jgi:predicted Ser/Thr protein kinase